MVRRKPSTWLEVAISHGGLRSGVRAITWAYLWGVTRERRGTDPTVEEVAECWHSSRSTAFRDQTHFRKAFPNYDTPAPLFEAADARRQVRATAKAMDELEQSLRKGTARVDRAILQLGMLPAT